MKAGPYEPDSIPWKVRPCIFSSRSLELVCSPKTRVSQNRWMSKISLKIIHLRIGETTDLRASKCSKTQSDVFFTFLDMLWRKNETFACSFEGLIQQDCFCWLQVGRFLNFGFISRSRSRVFNVPTDIEAHPKGENNHIHDCYFQLHWQLNDIKFVTFTAL